LNGLFPILLVLAEKLWVGSEDLTRGRLSLPQVKRKFIAAREFQLLSLERPGDAFAADLLPETAGFLIAHQKILVVDSGEMKS
jgi:hypothetical protein